MAYAVLTEIPWFNYEVDVELPVVNLQDDGPFDEYRVALAPIARRRYTWKMERHLSERLVVDAFFEKARKLSYSPFLLSDPKDYERTAVAIGVSTGGTVYSLPATGEEYRDYPVSGATFLVYDNGVLYAAGTVTVNTDARTFTLSVAIAAGHTVTASYQYYRLCRLDRAPSWSGADTDWFTAQPTIVEILRDRT